MEAPKIYIKEFWPEGRYWHSNIQFFFLDRMIEWPRQKNPEKKATLSPCLGQSFGDTRDGLAPSGPLKREFL